ncbi:MAG: hypothetical protein R3B45_02295 [Bdellovibrionota bacterium]
MSKLFYKIIFTVLMVLFLAGQVAVAKNLNHSMKSYDKQKNIKFAANSSKSKESESTSSQSIQLDKKLDDLSNKLRNGEISDKMMWESLSRITRSFKGLATANKVRLLQTQAQLLLDDNYPVISSIYASQAIKLLGKPFDPSILRSWAILREVSQKYPIQNLMVSLAARLNLKDKQAPKFNSDWFYYVGNAYIENKMYDNAVNAYSKVLLSDRYYFSAKYHEAIAHVLDNKPDQAVIALKKILYSSSQDLSPLEDDEKEEINNMTRLALGRIYYEKRDFEKSFRAYRAISKDSREYYDSLFEQAWAFFMGGFPNHALGALHSVNSPFFRDIDNPETIILRSMIYFWMCRYKESKEALVEFNEKHKESIKGLNYFLDRTNLTPESSYELFENYITGVSSESLQIPRELLNYAAKQDAMMQIRDQYATVLSEKKRLTTSGIYRTMVGTRVPLAYLESWEKSLRKSIGERFLKEVTELRDTYNRLYEQSQFLEVELLMSQKEHLLGKELHADKKMASVNNKRDLGGWGRSSKLSWAGSDVEEYWWDEVGYYIYQVKPECNQN